VSVQQCAKFAHGRWLSGVRTRRDYTQRKRSGAKEVTFDFYKSCFGPMKKKCTATGSLVFGKFFKRME